MLGIAVKGLVLLALTFLAALAMRRRSAAVRHLVWTAGLGATLALPVLSLLLPSWRVIRVPRPLEQTLATPVPPAVETSIRELPPVRRPVANARAEPAAVGEPILQREASQAPVRWSVVALSVWLAGAGIGLLWIALGEISVRRLRRRTRPLASPAWSGLVAETRDLIAVRKRGPLPIGGTCCCTSCRTSSDATA